MKYLFQRTEPAHAPGGLISVAESPLDFGNAPQDVLTAWVLSSQLRQCMIGLLYLALLDRRVGRLGLHERKNEGDTRKHDVQARRHTPLVMAVMAHVQVTPVVGKVLGAGMLAGFCSEETFCNIQPTWSQCKWLRYAESQPLPVSFPNQTQELVELLSDTQLLEPREQATPLVLPGLTICQHSCTPSNYDASPPHLDDTPLRWQSTSAGLRDDQSHRVSLSGPTE